MIADKPIKTLNKTRLEWLIDGATGHATGLIQESNPYPPEHGEAYDWWLFGWVYAQLKMLERN